MVRFFVSPHPSQICHLASKITEPLAYHHPISLSASLLQKLLELLSELNRSTTDSKEWLQQAHDVLNTITAGQQRRKQLANEEMRAVMQERDAAIAKVTMAAAAAAAADGLLWQTSY